MEGHRGQKCIFIVTCIPLDRIRVPLDRTSIPLDRTSIPLPFFHFIVLRSRVSLPRFSADQIVTTAKR